MASNQPGEDARRRLLAVEKKQSIATINEFAKIQTRIENELEKLLRRIDEERRTKGNASPGLLIQQSRLRDLLNAVTDEIFVSSQKLGLDTSRLQRSAIDIAQNAAGDYAQLEGNLSFFDSAATRELIGIAGDGAPLTKHFARLAVPIRQGLFDALFFGIATGRTNQQIAREINAVVGNGAAAAMTIVRTETNRAYREATRKFYSDTETVIGWRWLAALDLRTCPICWAMHGKIFKTKTKFGSHVNCRCTMVPVFAGDPKTPTGPEIFAGLTPAQQKTILGPARFDLYNRGAKLPDFVGTYTSPFGLGRRVLNLGETKFKPTGKTPTPPTPPTPKPKPIAKTPTPKPAPVPKPIAAPAPIERPNPNNIEPIGSIAPGTPVPTFANALEANKYMSDRFPKTIFRFFGMDNKSLNANAAELARLLDLYPETAHKLTELGTFEKAPKRLARAYAYCSTPSYSRATSSIMFNVKPGQYFNDSAKVLAKKEYGLKVGWSVSGDLQSTMTHEFGHAVDNWIQNNGNKTLQPFAFADGRNSITNIRMAIIRQLKPKKGELSDYGIHGRGETQRAEQFAEGFSMRWNRPEKDWPAFVKAQKRFIEFMQTQKLYSRDEQFGLRSLSEDKKLEALKQFEDFCKEIGINPDKIAGKGLAGER